jgi:hypothetical protein
LSRIINLDSAGKTRARLTKAIILAIRELGKQSSPNDESRDMAAFISTALASIDKGIDESVTAWEKRGYWVKADRFRMEWAWAGRFAEKMHLAVQFDDWETVADVATLTAQKLSKITVSSGNRIGKPWSGAWAEIKQK